MANPKRDWEHGWVRRVSLKRWEHESGLRVADEVVESGLLIPEHWLESVPPDETYRPCAGVTIRRRGMQNCIEIDPDVDFSKRSLCMKGRSARFQVVG